MCRAIVKNDLGTTTTAEIGTLAETHYTYNHSLLVESGSELKACNIVMNCGEYE